MQANIPESIDGSFYAGKVSISLRENCFEPSNKPIECHYHDGGPDHNVRHMRNKLANIAYFRKRDLDFLCSIQTSRQNSWKNPVERIMSIVNIGLCGTGVMRTECPTCEGILQNTSNMKQIRNLAKANPEVVEVKDSMNKAKELLKSLFRELKLKYEYFQTLDFLPDVMNRIDETFNPMVLVDTSKPVNIGEKLQH